MKIFNLPITPSLTVHGFAFLFLFFLLSLNSSNLFAQNSSKTVSAPQPEWTLYAEMNGVAVYTQLDECHDFKNGTHYEYIMLRFVNTTSDTKKIKWSENLYYNGKCSNCDGNSDKSIFEFELGSKESKQGNCGDDANDMFRIFNRFLNYNDKPVLTKFVLVNLDIK